MASRRKSKNGPKVKDLARHTHKGRRPVRQNSTSAKLVSPLITGNLSPTPHGPEPHWPAG
jgi:hypothetical protein